MISRYSAIIPTISVRMATMHKDVNEWTQYEDGVWKKVYKMRVVFDPQVVEYRRSNRGDGDIPGR